MKRSTFIFFLLSLITFSAYSQQNINSDSLQHISSDSIKKLGLHYLRSATHLTKTYAHELLKRSIENNDLKATADAYFQLGMTGQVTGDYSNSNAYFEKGISSIRVINDYLRLSTLYKEKGNTFYYQSKYKEALLNYQKAIDFAKNANNKEAEIVGYLNIALIKKKIGRYREALEIEKENLKKSRDIQFKKPLTSINLFINISSTFLALRENDSAIYYSEIGLKRSTLINDLEGVSYFQNTLGIAYHNKKAYKIALNHFYNALPIIDSLKNKKRSYSTHYLIGRTQFALNKYDTALFHLNKVDSLAQNIKDSYSEDLMESYKLLSQIHQIKGDDALSKNYLDKFVAQDSLGDIVRTDIIGDLYYADLNDKNGTLALVKKQKKNFEFISRIELFLLFAVISIAVLYFLRWRRNKKQFEKILSEQTLKNNTEQAAITHKSIKIADQKTKEILQKLKKTELNLYFLNSDFNLHTLSKKLKTNPTYLSKIINTYKEKKFTDYTNELRINYALKRLRDDTKFRSYSILHIAQELGYKSQDSFSRHFKKQTGIYPSFYIANINNL